MLPHGFIFGVSQRQGREAVRCCRSPGQACGGAGTAVCSCVCVFKAKASGVTGSVPPPGGTAPPETIPTAAPAGRFLHGPVGAAPSAGGQAGPRGGPRLFQARTASLGEGAPAAHAPPDGVFAVSMPNGQLRGFPTVGWSVGPTRSSSERAHSKHSCAAEGHPGRRTKRMC